MLVRMDRLLRLHEERGQVIVIITGVFVVLLIVVGLVTDAALIYVNYGHLRRAVDAAAVAAANQYRETRTIDEIYAGSVEFLQVQLPSGLYNAEVYWCAREAQDYQRLNYLGETTGETYQPHDASLCSESGKDPRKRIRVEAWLDVRLVFLSLIGFDQVRLFGQAESEAAVVNLVLLLDTSESMAYDTCPPTSPTFIQCLQACSGYDPDTGTFSSGVGWCQPFEDVRAAAAAFLDHMRPDVDEAAVYRFDKVPVITTTVSTGCDLLGQRSGVDCDPCLVANPTVAITITVSQPPTPQERGEVVALTANQDTIRAALSDNSVLHVYNRPRVPAPCEVLYTGGWMWQSTNIGGGLSEAAQHLQMNGNRDAAVWVIVLLTDGSANAADWETTGWWACPAAPYDTRYTKPRCRDAEATDADPTHPLTTTVTRHCPSLNDCADGPWYTQPYTEPFQARNYDADDYARDMADTAASYQIALYTIGFGDKVINDTGGGRVDAGERLLRYVSDVGDDGDLHTAPCGSDFYWQPRASVPERGAQCGNYYFAPDAEGLDRVFESIASRVFTRITK